MRRRTEWIEDPDRIPERYKVGARPLTAEEQVHQLTEAIDSLQALAAAVAAGRRHVVGPLASLLRALLYSRDGVPMYNPLLLRIAARAKVPLAVYAFEKDPGNRQCPVGPIPLRGRRSYVCVGRPPSSDRLGVRQIALIACETVSRTMSPTRQI